MRRDFRPFTTSLLKALARRSKRSADVRALRQAMRQQDLHATIYWLAWICADSRVANWLQEQFYFSGPDVGRAKSPIQNHLNTEAAYIDLFSWLAPAASRLLQFEKFSDSTVARAKHTLGSLKETEFKSWQRGQDDDSADLKRTNRKAWERRVQLRSRWKLKTLPSDHRVKRFSKFLREHESVAAEIRRPRQRYVDPRLAGHSRPATKGSATRIPDPLMREILRREFQDVARALTRRAK